LAGLRALLLSLLLVAILIVVLIRSLNNWQKEKQFKVLNKKREEHVVVICDGKEQMIVIHSVVLGDVVLFEPGKIVPCDGIFLLGHNVQCDKSGATGKSDAFKKLSVMILGTWPTFFFLFLTTMYLYDHMTSTHMTTYLYNRAISLGTPLFPPFVCFLLFSLYGSL